MKKPCEFFTEEKDLSVLEEIKMILCCPYSRLPEGLEIKQEENVKLFSF